MFTITYTAENKPREGEEVDPTKPKKGNKVLHLTQRNKRGGSKGDVIYLEDGETAEITIDASGVQITAVEVDRASAKTVGTNDETPLTTPTGENEEETE